MKKLFTIILMAATILTACTKENIPVACQIVTINAAIAGDTKVALGEGENEKKVNWTEGDVINLTIDETQYPFTWQEKTTFAYTGDAILPALTQGMQITATHASNFNSTQTGMKANVGNYMALSAEQTVTTEQSYGDLNLTFSHGTSVLKLTLSNDAFKGNDVTDITLKANGAAVVTATNTFTGSAENGSVTAYFAIQPGLLENVTVHATCASKEYTATLSDNTLESGKLYISHLDMAINKINYIDEYGTNRGTGVEIDGIIWAPVNCGYHPEQYPYGKLYQWGRKYGQGYSGSDDAAPNIISNQVTVDTGNKESNKNNFYKGANGYPNDWASNPSFKLWTSTETKTDYDPCPKGWRVPTSAEINYLMANSSVWVSDSKGYWYSGSKPYSPEVPQIFLPAAGRIKYTGTAEKRGTDGFYWTSSSDGRMDESYSLNGGFSDSRSHIEISMSRACGCSVRCVQQ